MPGQHKPRNDEKPRQATDFEFETLLTVTDEDWAEASILLAWEVFGDDGWH